MRLPIRTRLTLVYVVLLALVLIAVGLFVLVRLRADLTADFDRSLRSAAAQIGRGYERGGPVEFTTLTGTVRRVLPADSGAQIVSPGGRVVRSVGPDLPPSALLSAGELRRVVAGADLLDTRRGRGDSEAFRVFVTPIRSGGRRDALVVASSLEGVDAAVHRLLVLLLLAGPVALAAVAAAGWWLARAALRPVDRLTEHAERIEVDRLEERVPVPPTSDEIARLAITLNGMLERLARGVEDKRRLVADASHELRTPLALMHSELDLALDYGEYTADAREVFMSLRDEVARMSRTVENLLTLARVDEGRLELLRRPVSLRDVADEVVADLAPLASAHGVEVTATGDPVRVEADRDRLRQLLANLVENAIKHSDPGETVRVEVWCESGEARLRVSDEGAGIPPGELSRIFDRFHRVGRARSRDTGGSGLGLAICREIADAHGGRIWAESAEGRGSAFWLALSLPAARSRAG